jgi:hypothetical protein
MARNDAIAARLAALEQARKVVVAPCDEQRDLALARLNDLVEGRAEREYAGLNAAGRIGYWLRKIAEAEKCVATGGGPLEPLPNGYSAGLPEYMRELKLICCRDSLAGTYPFRLLQAQLDRLGELGYDSAKCGTWQAIMDRYTLMEWLWRPEYLDLPADAQALLGRETDDVPKAGQHWRTHDAAQS